MTSSSLIKNIVSSVNKGQTVKASELKKLNPQLVTALSKLVSPRDSNDRFDRKRTELKSGVGLGEIQSLSGSLHDRHQNNKNILELFPDLELAKQILISSILSPKDMTKIDLIYTSDMEGVTQIDMTSELSETLRDYINKNYNLKDELSEILEDMLFTNGCHIKAVLPEALIDYVIKERNVSVEDVDGNNYLVNEKMAVNEVFNSKGQLRSLNILGGYSKSSNKEISLEGISDKTVKNPEGYIVYKSDQGLIANEMVEIGDNFNFLKYPSLIKTKRKEALYNKVNAATESMGTSSNLNNVLYSNKPTDTNTVVQLPNPENLKRQSVGKPLVMNLNSSAVIPVIVPGSPKNHLGYFLVLDQHGNPIDHDSNTLDASLVNDAWNSNSGESNGLDSFLVKKAKNNLQGKDVGVGKQTEVLLSMYGAIVEENLLNRLKNGMYSDDLHIGDNSDIYRVMLARTLKGKMTKLVFVPSEFIEYMAFEYFDNGIGKSLLDKLSVNSSIRAMVMFAEVMSYIKSSINTTKVNMKLDENDPDPFGTIEILKHEVARMRQQMFPIGINSPSDLVDWMQKMALEFTYEGHPGIPDVQLDFEVSNTQHTLPESELADNLKKQAYMTFGLSPEIVDNGFSSDFATTVVANNILLSKRVMVYQDKLKPQLTSYIKSILEFDGDLREEMRKIVQTQIDKNIKYLTEEDKKYINDNNKEIYVESLLTKYVKGLEIDIPSPNETTLENQLTAYNAYADALDVVIESWISDEAVPAEVAGDISDYIVTMKELLKAYFLRKWAANNNFMPELTDITSVDKDKKALIDIYDISEHHIEGLQRAAIKLMKNTIGKNKATDEIVEKINNGESLDEESGQEEDLGLDKDSGEEDPKNKKDTEEDDLSDLDFDVKE